MPLKPLARAAAIKSSGLEIPSPEKKECVCRSMLSDMATPRVKVTKVTKLQRRIAYPGKSRREACNDITVVANRCNDVTFLTLLHQLFDKNGCFGFAFHLSTIELVIVQTPV